MRFTTTDLGLCDGAAIDSIAAPDHMTGSLATAALAPLSVPTVASPLRRSAVTGKVLSGMAKVALVLYNLCKAGKSRATRTWTQWVEAAAESSTTEGSWACVIRLALSGIICFIYATLQTTALVV